MGDGCQRRNIQQNQRTWGKKEEDGGHRAQWKPKQNEQKSLLMFYFLSLIMVRTRNDEWKTSTKLRKICTGKQEKVDEGV
jgi:hypothetical protein